MGSSSSSESVSVSESASSSSSSSVSASSSSSSSSDVEEAPTPVPNDDGKINGTKWPQDDQHESCEGWAKKDPSECLENIKYMWRLCYASCSAEGFTVPPTAAPTDDDLV